MLLRGEPGIGKTRLCAELSRRAAVKRITVAWGRCWETPGAPPCWPWRQLFDELAVGSSELEQALWGLAGPGTAPSPHEAHRAELSRLVTRALRTRLEQGPLLLVLEDLHAADLPTLQLLHFAVRTLKRAPLLWLLTARDRDPRLTDAHEGLLARLAREGTRLEPTRLDAPAVAELAGALLPYPLPEAAVQSVVKATEGTPLYVDGTLRLIGAPRHGRAAPARERERHRARAPRAVAERLPRPARASRGRWPCVHARAARRP